MYDKKFVKALEPHLKRLVEDAHKRADELGLKGQDKINYTWGYTYCNSPYELILIHNLMMADAKDFKKKEETDKIASIKGK